MNLIQFKLPSWQSIYNNHYYRYFFTCVESEYPSFMGIYKDFQDEYFYFYGWGTTEKVGMPQSFTHLMDKEISQHKNVIPAQQTFDLYMDQYCKLNLFV